MPQRSWPSWYKPTPGWGFTDSMMLGSIRAELNWLRWGWPKYYGPQPAVFMYQTGYVPTPWIYVPWLNQWQQFGQMAYCGAPPPDYTMPITVETVEPVEITAVNEFGIPVREIVNQIVMYNAYYYPLFGRWGYINRQGYFVWVNPRTAFIMSPEY